MPLVHQLDYHILIRVLDIEDVCFIPYRLVAVADVRLREARVLVDFHQVLAAFLEVLSVDDVHFEFRIATNAHLSHILSLSLHRLMQLLLDFILLASVVNDVTHHFHLTFQQVVPRLNILHDVFVSS